MIWTGRYSDLTIKCKEKVFRVHRNVVCLQSKPLAAHLNGGFIEAVTGEINFIDDEPEIIEKEIKFLYERDYCDGSSLDVKEDSKAINDQKTASAFNFANTSNDSVERNALSEPLITKTKLYITADKYDIPALKELANIKYVAAVSVHWNSPSFTASIELIYKETPESDHLLKDVAISAAASHINELIRSGRIRESV